MVLHSFFFSANKIHLICSLTVRQGTHIPVPLSRFKVEMATMNDESTTNVYKKATEFQ
jgi:hypothetical protein